MRGNNEERVCRLLCHSVKIWRKERSGNEEESMKDNEAIEKAVQLFISGKYN